MALQFNASSGGSQTSVELRPLGRATEDQTPLSIKENNDPAEFLPQPSTTVHVVERWNSPRVNIYRTLSTFFAFIIMGANDAAYGALIPYVGPTIPFPKYSDRATHNS